MQQQVAGVSVGLAWQFGKALSVAFPRRVVFGQHRPHAAQAAQLPSQTRAAQFDLRLLRNGTHLGSNAATDPRCARPQTSFLTERPTMLTTQRITSSAELAALEDPWNALADGEPLRSWDWLATWWKHYGKVGNRSLNVFAAYNGKQLVGVAPWYVEQSRTRGRSIRFLGDGHVCTDHLSLICSAMDAERVASAIADTLAASNDWDRIELEAVDENDAAIGRLMTHLEQHDCLVSRQFASNCWILDVPETWEAYLKIISQSHKRQLKKCQRELVDTGRATLHIAKSPDELDKAWEVLVDLHQRRAVSPRRCFTIFTAN
jgi:CelD/BcsL family acetyltransferase involved in cellulose biosynthesis